MVVDLDPQKDAMHVGDFVEESAWPTIIGDAVVASLQKRLVYINAGYCNAKTILKQNNIFIYYRNVASAT